MIRDEVKRLPSGSAERVAGKRPLASMDSEFLDRTRRGGYVWVEFLMTSSFVLVLLTTRSLRDTPLGRYVFPWMRRRA